MSEHKKFALYKRNRGDSYESIIDYLKSKSLNDEFISEIISELKEFDKQKAKEDAAFDFLKDSTEELVEKEKRDKDLLIKENETFRKEIRNGSIIGFSILGLGVLYHLNYMHESRSINSLLSWGVIVIGWGIFINSLFKHRKLINWKGFVLPISLVLMMGTSFVISTVTFGGDITALRKELNSNSPFILTTVTKKEYQVGFRRKSQRVQAAWIYHFEFTVNEENFTGTTPLPDDIYDIDDTIRVIYNQKNPSINKLDIKY